MRFCRLSEEEAVEVLVLDSSAFLMGYDPLSGAVCQYTVQGVLDEVRDRSARLRIQTAVDTGALKVEEPSKESREKVTIQSTLLGDMAEISATDLDVLAVAADLSSSGRRCSVVTDDYAVQNVANKIGISFKSLATRGIKYEFQWRQYCPACGRSYPSSYKGTECTVCGTRLRRRVLKKRTVSRANSSRRRSPLQPES